MSDFELEEHCGWAVYTQNPHTGDWSIPTHFGMHYVHTSEPGAHEYASDSSRVEEVTIRPVCLGADPVQWAAVMLAFGLLSALANLDKPGWWTHLRDAMPSFGGSLEREP